MKIPSSWTKDPVCPECQGNDVAMSINNTANNVISKKNKTWKYKRNWQCKNHDCKATFQTIDVVAHKNVLYIARVNSNSCELYDEEKHLDSIKRALGTKAQNRARDYRKSSFSELFMDREFRITKEELEQMKTSLPPEVNINSVVSAKMLGEYTLKNLADNMEKQAWIRYAALFFESEIEEQNQSLVAYIEKLLKIAKREIK